MLNYAERRYLDHPMCEHCCNPNDEEADYILHEVMGVPKVILCGNCGSNAEEMYSSDGVTVFNCEHCGSTISVYSDPNTALDNFADEEEKRAAVEGYEDIVLTITQRVALTGATAIMDMLHGNMEQMTDKEKVDALYLLRETLNSLFED